MFNSCRLALLAACLCACMLQHAAAMCDLPACNAALVSCGTHGDEGSCQHCSAVCASSAKCASQQDACSSASIPARQSRQPYASHSYPEAEASYAGFASPGAQDAYTADAQQHSWPPQWPPTSPPKPPPDYYRQCRNNVCLTALDACTQEGEFCDLCVSACARKPRCGGQKSICEQHWESQDKGTPQGSASHASSFQRGVDALYQVIDDSQDTQRLFTALHAKAAQCPDGSCIQYDEMAQVFAANVPQALKEQGLLPPNAGDPPAYQPSAYSGMGEAPTQDFKLKIFGKKIKIKIPKQLCVIGCHSGAAACTAAAAAVSGGAAAAAALVVCEGAAQVCEKQC